MQKKDEQQLAFESILRSCVKHPKLFLNEAISLRYTAEVLYEFEKI